MKLGQSCLMPTADVSSFTSRANADDCFRRLVSQFMKSDTCQVVRIHYVLVTDEFPYQKTINSFSLITPVK